MQTHFSALRSAMECKGHLLSLRCTEQMLLNAPTCTYAHVYLLSYAANTAATLLPGCTCDWCVCCSIRFSHRCKNGYTKEFVLVHLLSYLPVYNLIKSWFHDWCQQAGSEKLRLSSSLLWIHNNSEVDVITYLATLVLALWFYNLFIWRRYCGKKGSCLDADMILTWQL